MALPYATPPYLYTSEDERKRLLGTVAFEAHVDDEQDDTDIQLEIDIRSTARVNSILQKIFSPVDMAGNPWVREKATIIGAYLETYRRGNPGLYYEQYIEAMEELQAVVTGELFLDLPRAGNASVVFQNISTDNRFPLTPMRVDPISATQLTGQEFISRYLSFSWL